MKTLIISINLLAISIIPFILVGIVYVNHDAPQTIDAGNTVEVKVTINKGSITGPAKLKIDFSDAMGLSAEEISSAGAAFSFGDGVANFNWLAIDASEVIEIKYRLKADINAVGTKTISGKFSYLDEEERKTMVIPSIIIEVKNTNTSVVSNPNNTNPSSPTSVTDISCYRTIEKLGNDVLVTLNLSKGNNSGFARLVENIPAGFTASEVQNAGSVFKFSDNAAKFLWTNIPGEKSELILKYKLTPPSDASGDFSIDGEFSGAFLIIDEVPTSIMIKSTSFNLSSLPEGTLANEPNNNTNNTNNSSNSSNSSSTNTNSGNKNSNRTSNNSSSSDNNESGSSNGVKYKVQVLAGHSNISTSSIKKQYSFDGKITIENHDGWVKYCTGNYETYKDAKTKRNDLGSFNFPGPFVVAYNNGSRISVQEALAISKQSWVQ